MQIKKSGLGVAVCEGMGTTREVDTLLVGDQPPGTWVLVFLNSAREILTEDNAMKISNAVRAVDSVMSHQDGMSTQSLNRDRIDALFADLIDREPQKPASLIALEQARLKQGK
jgi:hydrogenase expression/formation protein HypC